MPPVTAMAEAKVRDSAARQPGRRRHRAALTGRARDGAVTGRTATSIERPRQVLPSPNVPATLVLKDLRSSTTTGELGALPAGHVAAGAATAHRTPTGSLTGTGFPGLELWGDMDKRCLRTWRPRSQLATLVGLVGLATVGIFPAPATAAPGKVAAAASPSRMSSGLVHWRGAIWRADAVQNGEAAPISVEIYRSSVGTWRTQGQVRLTTSEVGPEAGDLATAGGSLYPAALTGAPGPDFVMVTQGPGQSPWFSVISGAGGRWHAVPVDFGYRPLIGVPAKVRVEGRLLRAEVEGQDYSPSTTGWFAFRGGAFAPSGPPGAHTSL